MNGFCIYDSDAALDDGVYPVISVSMNIGNYSFTHNSLSRESPYFVVGTTDCAYIVRSDNVNFEGIVFEDGISKSYENFSGLWKTL